MTPQLRKAHRYIWFSLAVMLPAGWLAAVLAIPGEVAQQPLRPEEPRQLPVCIHSKQSGDLLINLRQDSSGERRQIEIVIAKPLENPNTTLVLERPGNHQGDLTLGQLGTRGIRRFDLDSLDAESRTLTLRFEDHIRGQLLRKHIIHL